MFRQSQQHLVCSSFPLRDKKISKTSRIIKCWKEVKYSRISVMIIFPENFFNLRRQKLHYVKVKIFRNWLLISSILFQMQDYECDVQLRLSGHLLVPARGCPRRVSDQECRQGQSVSACYNCRLIIWHHFPSPGARTCSNQRDPAANEQVRLGGYFMMTDMILTSLSLSGSSCRSLSSISSHPITPRSSQLLRNSPMRFLRSQVLLIRSVLTLLCVQVSHLFVSDCRGPRPHGGPGRRGGEHVAPGRGPGPGPGQGLPRARRLLLRLQAPHSDVR